MRLLLFLLAPCILCAQSTETDQRLLQSLVSEMQQLRMSIERSTLLSARAQLATSRLQLQEAAVARIAREYRDVRSNLFPPLEISELTEEIKTLEQKVNAPENAAVRGQIEAQLKQAKFQLDRVNAAAQQRQIQEGELASQLRAAQSELTDSQNRMADMEKSLDAAIQQSLKQK